MCPSDLPFSGFHHNPHVVAAQLDQEFVGAAGIEPVEQLAAALAIDRDSAFPNLARGFVDGSGESHARQQSVKLDRAFTFRVASGDVRLG